jgi:hypothetical protein
LHLETLDPKNAQQLISRMREIEKIQLRAASPAAVEHMRVQNFGSDGPPSLEVVQEAQQLLLAEYATASDGPFWERQTWMI